jgi:hypothetical protein
MSPVRIWATHNVSCSLEYRVWQGSINSEAIRFPCRTPYIYKLDSSSRQWELLFCIDTLMQWNYVRRSVAILIQEVLGRTNRLLSFDATRIARKITRTTVVPLFYVHLLPQ